jgi:hypothetical protein
MFGKLKKLVIEVESLWASIQVHAKDIVKLRNDLSALQKDIKALKAAAKPEVKKTTK